MIRSLILWLSTGVLTPLLYLLTKPLHVSKSGLYSLVLTCCAMLGSGQLVLGQDLPNWGAPSSTATVNVFNPILTDDIYNPTVTDAQHTSPVTIHTQLVYRELFITEIVYNPIFPPVPADYSDFVYPFGRKMEITTTNALTTFDLNNYSLIFYRVCDNVNYVNNVYSLADLHCYSSLTNLTDITTVAAQTAFIVDLPSFSDLNAGATLTNCPNNEQQLIIALVKNPAVTTNLKLLNLIGINIDENIGLSTTNGIIIDSSTDDNPNFDGSTYKPVKIAPKNYMVDNINWPNPASWYLNLSSWKGYPANPNPLGVVNNVITCNYYIPRYDFTDLPGGTPGYRQFCVVPNQIGGQETGNDHFLPSQLSTQMYYSCDGVNWDSNITCQTSTTPNNGWTNSLPYHQRNVLTMQYTAEKGFEYFKNVHGQTNWWSLWSGYHYHLEQIWAKQKVYRSVMYNPASNLGAGVLGNQLVQISQGLGTISGVGHELGHNFYSLLHSGTWTHEGFADIWGTCIEKYALGLTKPQYLILTTGVGINRSLKNDIINIAGNETYHVVYNGYIYNQQESHGKGRLLGHWFYLLAEGEEKMLLNERMVGSNYQNIPKYVCGIGDALAARIIFKMSTVIVDGGPVHYEGIYGVTNLLNQSLAAVDALAAIPAEVTTYPELQNPAYVKAQIKNAWAAVNLISDPDFDINNNNTASSFFDENEVTICPGETLSLTASGYGTEIWHHNGAVVGSGGNLIIPNVSSANNGVYEVTETYTSPTGTTCEKTRTVTVTVEDMWISANQNPICTGANLVLTAMHGNVQTGSIKWYKDGVIIATQDYPLSITNIQPNNAGTYTVTANCVTPGGSLVPISADITINVSGAPASSNIEIGVVQNEISIPGNTTICSGQQLQLYASGGNVTWTEPSQDPFIMLVSPTTTTTYHAQICNPVCPNLCTTATITVTVNPLPNPTITPTLNNCTVTLTAAGGSTYAWSTTESTPSIEVTTPNTYTVTVTNTNGCTATAQYTVDATQIATIANFSGDYTVGAMANPLGVYATNTETWNNPSGLRIAGQIIIPNGKHLIIDQTTLEMIGHDSRITVQKGGKMTVTNQAVLRGDACTNDYWKGIRVLGDGTGHTGNIPQVNFNTGHYGWLRVFNGSTIQDAQIGIANTTDDLSTANAGGIISCTASNLIDNGQGVFLMPVKKYNNCSIITDNQFSFTKTYNYPYLSGSLTQQIGMVAVLTRFSNNLQNNRFVNTTNNNIIDLGTGYVLLSCRANIGGSGLYDGITEFSNLFKGIDAYNLWALEDQIKVHDNDFEQVHKGVSLNNGVFSGVFNNSFTYIQNGDNTGPGTAYGVYARNTYGIQIANNNFACSAPNNNGLQNIGVVLDNTGSYQNTLVNNSFSGNFGRATTFINTNKNVLADCNLYALNNNIDWYINGFLNDQGVCIVPTPELARRNSFHQYLPGINYYNISRVFDGTWFNYVGQVGFNPQFVAGGVSVDNTCPATEAVSHCTLNPDNCDPDCLLAQIDEATDNEKLIELYSYLLRQRIDLNQIEWGKLDLSRENRIDAQKVLIATLESQDSTEIALQKLADLPVESPDDAAFKTLYYQLLTGITPPAGSGKAMPAQEQLLRNTANTNNTANAAMAQSIVATYYHQTFNKNVPAVELTANNIATSVYLTIFPNPTSNEITVSTKDFLLPAELLITDLYGKTVKRVPITNNNTTINGFGTGIYFCNLVKDNAVISTQKFVVIR